MLPIRLSSLSTASKRANFAALALGNNPIESVENILEQPSPRSEHVSQRSPPSEATTHRFVFIETTDKLMNITVRVHDSNLSHSRIERDDKDSSAVCWGTATKNAYALFLRFRNRILGGFEADLRMRPVAKRFLGGSATAAECHSFFDREFVPFGVDQFHFARHDVRAVLDCRDLYVSQR